MARPISHERRSTERLCMLDTACLLAYASGIRLAGRGLFADRDVRIARLLSANTPPRFRYGGVLLLSTFQKSHLSFVSLADLLPHQNIYYRTQPYEALLIFYVCQML